MEEKVVITFHAVDHSDVLQERIRSKADKLIQKHPFLEAVRIVVDAPHHHKNKGNLYQIRIDMRVAGEELVINKQPFAELQAHENPFTAVNSAFRAAQKIIDKYTDKRQGNVKLHTLPNVGYIARLNGSSGYIKDVSGESEIYFDEQAVSEDEFKYLQEGDQVQFELGEKEKKPLISNLRRFLSQDEESDNTTNIQSLAS